MARLVGVDLPREKRMEIALTYIYGIGRTRAKESLAATTSTRTCARKISPTTNWSSFATGSRSTTKPKVTSAARLLLTSAARWRLVPTRASATAADCRYVVSALTPTPGDVKVRARPLARRRSPRSSPSLPTRPLRCGTDDLQE